MPQHQTSLYACNLAVQEMLENLTPTTYRQLRQMGALRYALEQQAKYPVAKNMINKDGKYKKYQIIDVPAICDIPADCQDLCNMESVSPSIITLDREISKCHMSNKIKFTDEQLRAICMGESEYISKVMAKHIEPYLKEFDKKLLAEIYAHRGLFTDGTVIKSIKLINNDLSATAQGFIVDEDLREAGFPAAVSVIGGKTVSLYRKAIGNGGLNAQGQNVNDFSAFDTYIDYDVNTVSPSTAENIFVLADGVMNLVTWSENVGFFGSDNKDIFEAIRNGRQYGGTKWKGVLDLITLFPDIRELGLNSFVVDYEIKYSDCPDEWTMVFWLNYDVWFNEPSRCTFEGVNGIQHWQVCQVEPQTCAPVTAPPPVVPQAARCFIPNCPFPGVLFAVKVGQLLLYPNAPVTSLQEIVDVLNQLEPAKFKVQGTQIQYKGDATVIELNGVPAPFVACLQGDCYCGDSPAILSPAQITAYNNLGGGTQLGTLIEVANNGTSASYVFTPLVGQTVTLAQLQAYSLAQADNVTWIICATCGV